MPKTRLCAVLIIAMLAPKPFAAAQSTQACEPSAIALRIDESGAVVVPVSINGGVPVPFLLDTGSTHSVVSRALVDRLALDFVAKTSVLTSTGREWRPVVRLDQTTIAGAKSDGLLASVVPSAQLDEIALGIDGIIGQDFLFGLNYTLDYRRKRLVWSDGSTADGTRLPLLAQGGRYVVQVMAPGDNAPLFLVPDSGASGFVMFERDGRTRVPLDGAPERSSVHSVAGRQDVRMMVLREVRLGDATVRHQRVAVLQRAASDALEGDGLLPLHLFSSVSFNARGGYLLLRGIP
jgi:hypothetical protein